MTTTTKPRSLILRPHEARRLAETGEALIVREVKPQPKQDAHGWTWNYGKPTSRNDKFIGTTCPDDRDIARLMLDYSPFGPVGSPLVGKESWHASLIGDVPTLSYAAAVEADDVFAYVISVELWDQLERPTKTWSPARTMPIAASRFPRLIHAACEVKRVADATWEDVAAMGLPDQPRQIVKPGSNPIEYINFDPHHVITEFTQIIAETWAWFSLVRNTEYKER